MLLIIVFFPEGYQLSSIYPVNGLLYRSKIQVTVHMLSDLYPIIIINSSKVGTRASVGIQ